MTDTTGRAVNSAVRDADAYPLRLHLTDTNTFPVTEVVTLSVRHNDVESGQPSTAATPDTRDAEHDALDGDTEKPSIIAPAPERDAPPNPEMLTSGRARYSASAVPES